MAKNQTLFFNPGSVNMKVSLASLAALLMLSLSAFGKIVVQDDKLYVESKGNRVPLGLVNSMIQEKSISDIKLYANGKIHMISFSKNGEREKIYSVDEKGFVYSIEPFSSYSVSRVDQDNLIHFKEVKNRRYKINSKGFFLY